MKSILHRAILLLPALGCSNTLAGEPASVALAPLDEVAWRVTFSVTDPTTRLKLIRTPDDSRLHRWSFRNAARREKTQRIRHVIGGKRH